MSIADEANKIVQERITGSGQQKETVSIRDKDPSYGIKDSKDEVLDRIENNLKEINENLKEIIRLEGKALKMHLLKLNDSSRIFVIVIGNKLPSVIFCIGVITISDKVSKVSTIHNLVAINTNPSHIS